MSSEDFVMVAVCTLVIVLDECVSESIISDIDSDNRLESAIYWLEK